MIGRILGKRYEILEKIGGGGMALVYKAKCNLLNRYVAVKILRPEFISDEDFINKFEKESQAAASLSHQNIVNIYDVGTDDGIHYIVMEYVNGRTLKKYIKENGFLKNDEVINISKQIASALQHAHNNHIVHRDIKPHNILITEDGRAKVTDFGIARAITSSTITNTGNVIGSVHYFSPEQARGGFVDEKSDIYSLGVTMFEMITGRVPFSGNTPITVALRHLKEEVVPPSMINQDISTGLENIILKSMHKDKNKRYDNAGQLYNDLEKALKDPQHSIIIVDDDESPTKVIPSINDLDEIDDLPNEPKKTSKLTLTIGILSALIISVIVVAGIFLNMFKEKFIIQEVKIPNVTEKSQDVAENSLKDLGLEAMVENEYFNNKVPQGHVISQDPLAGEEVKKGFMVRLTLSKGPEKVFVPEIVNKPIEEGKVLLENNQLVIGDIKYEYDDLPIGTIIKQDPVDGTEVIEGATIKVVVSQGSQVNTIMMPNLLGKGVDDAKSIAKKLGLVIKDISYDFSEEYEKDMVIYQSISSGKEVEESSVFNIVVSKGSENPEQPNEGEELTEVKKITAQIPLTFDKEEEMIKVIKIQDGVSSVIYQNVHKKSEKSLELSMRGSGKAKIEVYFGEILAFTKEDIFDSKKKEEVNE